MNAELIIHSLFRGGFEKILQACFVNCFYFLCGECAVEEHAEVIDIAAGGKIVEGLEDIQAWQRLDGGALLRARIHITIGEAI